MANARKSNVQVVDTTAQLSGQLMIKTIKYVGAATSSVVIRLDDAAGTVVWEDSSSTNACDHGLCINAKDGVHVTVTGTAKVYLYLG